MRAPHSHPRNLGRDARASTRVRPFCVSGTPLRRTVPIYNAANNTMLVSVFHKIRSHAGDIRAVLTGDV